MSNIIFNNIIHHNCFIKDGFVVLYNFFEPDFIEKLKNLYAQSIPNTNYSFYTTQWIPDYNYKNKISKSIGLIINERILKLVNNYQNIFAYFMVKHGQDTSFSHAHQDWSIVDESKHISINCWLPLVSVKENNGAMKILPKSHLKYNNPRGTDIKNSMYDHLEILKTEKFITLNLNLGDLLLFDSRLIHATSDNITNTTRVAVGSILKPTNAKVFHYYNKNNKTENIELDNDFLLKYSFGQNFYDFLQQNYEKDIY